MREYLLLTVGVVLVLYGTGTFTGFLVKEGGVTAEVPEKPQEREILNLPEKKVEAEANETEENQTLKTVETEKDLCKNVECERGIITCPDGETFFCINTCIPETGKCTSCVPDCTGHEKPAKQQNIESQETESSERKEQEGPEEQGLDHIIFSQVYYNAEGDDSKNEWVELYNPTGEDIDISGYTLNDNHNVFLLPEGSIIKSGTFFVVARDSSGFYNLSGCLPDVDGSTLRLSNSGDYIYLNSTKREIDYVSWNEWEISAGEGRVIARKDMQTDTDSAKDWLGNQDPVYRC